MLSVRIKISDQLAATLTRLEQTNYQRAAALGGYRFLRQYHLDFRDKWRGSHWFPGPQSGEFARRVIEGWQPPVLSGQVDMVVNNFGLLAWKITGGTITPKRAKMLTIPLIGAAKGVRARDFAGGQLFRAGNALCRRLDKKLQPVYALSKGVTQAPWPGAMPSKQDVADAAREAGEAALQQAIKGG